MLDQGSYATLGLLGTFTWANGINDSGQIVGYFDDESGGQHGFVATPVP